MAKYHVCVILLCNTMYVVYEFQRILVTIQSYAAHQVIIENNQ